MRHRRTVNLVLASAIACGLPWCRPGVVRADERADLLAAFTEASELEKKNDYAGAAKAYERALELTTRTLGPDHGATATVLNNLAVAYWNLGQYVRAEPLFHRCLKIRETQLGADHLIVARTLDNLALMYDDMRQYSKAEPLCRRSIEIREARLGPDHLDVADGLNTLASLYRSMNQYAKAEPLYERSLKIREAQLGPDHIEVAKSLNNLALLYDSMGQYAKAEPLCQRSLKIREAQLGPDDPGVADSLNGLADLYEKMSQYAQAEPLYQRSLKIREARLGPDHPDVAKSLNNLAILYDKLGQYAQAEPLCRRSLKIREARLGPDHPDVAESLNILAGVYWNRGQFAQAEPLYQRSLRIYESKRGPDHPEVADSLNNLAILYVEMGQYAKAEPLYQRSLKIREAQLGADHPFVGESLNSLAALYVRMQQYAKAEPLCQRSLKIREAQLGPDHPYVADTLNILAIVYHDTGEYAKAEPLLQRCLKISESKFGPDHRTVAAYLNNLGVLNKCMGQYAQAEPLYQRSLQIHESQLGSDHPSVAQYGLFNLAYLHAATQRWAEALAETDRERRIVRRHVARTLPALSEKEQLAFLQTQDEDLFHAALSLALLRRSDAQSAQSSAGWVLNGKAVAQEVLAQRAILAAEGSDPALAELVKRLLGVRSRLATLSMTLPASGQEADYRRQVQALGQQEQELSRQLGQATGRIATDDPWIETAAVREALAKDALLVEIARHRLCNFKAQGNENWWSAPHYAVWLIPPDGRGEVSIVDLGEAGPIDASVGRARQTLQNAGKTIREDGEAASERQLREAMADLARLVFQPLEKQFGEARQLIFSPDSALWLVPWGALPLADGTYAIEKYEIRYVISGRDLVGQARSKTRSPTDPILFANPNFDLEPGDADAATRAVLRSAGPVEQVASSRGLGSLGTLPRVDPLPGTAAEAEAIKPSVTTYARAEPTLYEDRFALEGVFKALHRPRLLVLSTHGFFMADQEAACSTQRAEGLAQEGTKGAAALTAEGKPLENPLLRCGLLLAGCNKRVEDVPAGVDDGILTGMEIVGTDLHGTELVVLSACETGLGQVRNGEGVAGLRQAFQLAGAKAVVSTLWQIPDQETVQLMTDFFANLSAGRSKAESLRNAQIAIIKTRRENNSAAHPYYWAAFTLTGE